MGRNILENSLAEAIRGMKAKSVIDVGGAWESTGLATHILDIEPRNNRHNFADWIQGDICQKETWDQFDDNQFDFAICTQTLEDIYDPITVCNGLSRVARCGYLETPSMIGEITRFSDRKKDNIEADINGYLHHRYIIEVINGTDKERISVLPVVSPEWKPKGKFIQFDDDAIIVAIPKTARVLINDLLKNNVIAVDTNNWNRVNFVGLFWKESIKCVMLENDALDYIRYKILEITEPGYLPNYNPIKLQRRFAEVFEPGGNNGILES